MKWGKTQGNESNGADVVVLLVMFRGVVKKEYLLISLGYFYFSIKHMLWVFIRSTSARRF